MNNILKQIGFFFVFLAIVIVFFTFVIFYWELKSFSNVFITAHGLVGMLVIIFLLEVFIQPISPDVLVFGATFAGWQVLPIALFAGIASCAGGMAAYFLGSKLGMKGCAKWFGKRNWARGEGIFKKYGILAVAIGALSPIPYSLVSWSAGIYHMKFSQFLTTSLWTRIPRFIISTLR